MTNDSAVRSAPEPSSMESFTLTLARQDPAGCPANLRPPRIALCGHWREVQTLCALLSDRARLTWYGDPQAIGSHDLVVYVADDTGNPWSVGWVREARSRAGSTPVVVVTPGSSELGGGRFVAAGASACIEGTLDAEKLVARLLAMSRGSGTYSAIHSRRVEVDPALRMVRIGDMVARVTTTELLIFQYLVSHANCWKTASDILQDVLGDHHCPRTPVVRVHVFRLRRALGDMAHAIESHQGKGYRFRVEGETLLPASLETEHQ
jgi:DNA-binding response OmpR family regulator